MKKSLSLNGVWQLTYAEGNHLSVFEEFSQVQPAVGRRLLDVQVPSPIHRELEKNCLLDDPNYGINSLSPHEVERLKKARRQMRGEE